MQTFTLTDLPPKETKTETFHDGQFSVVSRSGIHPAEALLIARLAALSPAPAALLVAGNRTGAAALVAAARFPGCAVTCHTFDLHHARAVRRNLLANGVASAFRHDPFVTVPADFAPAPSEAPARFTVACTSAIPAGPYDTALFMASSGTTTSELILDQLEDIHANLAPGGTCVIACEAESGPLLKQFRALFGHISIHHDKHGVFCASAVRHEPLARPRDFSAAFPASLPGGDAHTLVSLPGVFCHRRPDAGGLALAEVAARDLRPGLRVLDIGCGCGLVGILLAKSQPDIRPTFIDSHARALAATRRNLDALGIEKAKLILSDQGTDLTGYHLAAGNPPYYSDFRIAELFIGTAFNALAPGGTCLMVAKATRALEELQHERFGNTEIIPRRGYGVVKSTRHRIPATYT